MNSLQVFVCVVLCVSWCKAQQQYYISPTGVDAVGRGTQTQPFRTLEYAAFYSFGAKNVTVLAGVYTGPKNFPDLRSLSVIEGDTVIQAENMSNPDAFVFNSCDDCGPLTIKKGIKVLGLTLHGNTNTTNTSIAAAQGGEFSHCRFLGYRSPTLLSVYPVYGNNVTLSNNVFEFNEQNIVATGISIQNISGNATTSDYVTLNDNTFLDARSGGNAEHTGIHSTYGRLFGMGNKMTGLSTGIHIDDNALVIMTNTTISSGKNTAVEVLSGSFSGVNLDVTQMGRGVSVATGTAYIQGCNVDRTPIAFTSPGDRNGTCTLTMLDCSITGATQHAILLASSSLDYAKVTASITRVIVDGNGNGNTDGPALNVGNNTAATLSQVTFTNNLGKNGGALFCENGASVSMTSSSLSNVSYNQAKDGGAGYCLPNCTFTIISSYVTAVDNVPLTSSNPCVGLGPVVYYISSVDGVDAPGRGTTREAPFATLSYPVFLNTVEKVIFVLPGVYSGKDNFPNIRSRSTTAGLEIRGDTTDPQEYVFNAVGCSDCDPMYMKDGVKIRDVTFTGYLGTTYGAVTALSGGEIENCRFYGNNIHILVEPTTTGSGVKVLNSFFEFSKSNEATSQGILVPSGSVATGWTLEAYGNNFLGDGLAADEGTAFNISLGILDARRNTIDAMGYGLTMRGTSTKVYMQDSYISEGEGVGLEIQSGLLIANKTTITNMRTGVSVLAGSVNISDFTISGARAAILSPGTRVSTSFLIVKDTTVTKSDNGYVGESSNNTNYLVTATFDNFQVNSNGLERSVNGPALNIERNVKLYITNSNFRANNGDKGGAVFCGDGGIIDIFNTDIDRSIAIDGSAAYCEEFCAIQARDVKTSENYADVNTSPCQGISNNNVYEC
eukprot:m.28709 g.28709  ORF g.28709 m.28709 type:complete len:892 (-) comp8027_c0_seq1:21-2696(-)